MSEQIGTSAAAQLHNTTWFDNALFAGYTCLGVLPHGLDWHNLLLEPARVTGLGSSLVRGHSHLVLQVPGNAILGSYVLGCHTCNSEGTFSIKLCRRSPATFASASAQSKPKLQVLQQQKHGSTAAN